MDSKKKPQQRHTGIRVPLLVIPMKAALGISHTFFGISSRVLKKDDFLDRDLYKIESNLTAEEYINISVLNSLIWSFFTFMVGVMVFVRMKSKTAVETSLGAAVVIGASVFLFCMAYPRWMCGKKTKQIDRNLLYAARHLRVQTTAGVPLFDSLVSATSGYGAVSEEINKIVTAVQGGTNLAYAIEDSALKNPSYYYNRIMWQLSNAVKAGTDIGPVLNDIVTFLAEEQRIDMRNYGSQLNTIAIMYLMACIIVPTVSLIFLLIVSSFVEIPLTDTVFLFILGGMVFVQYMFIGLIENRRPAVSV